MFKDLLSIPLLLCVTACMGLNTTKPQSAMPGGDLAQAPKAYLDFCERDPVECVAPLFVAASAKSQEHASSASEAFYVPANLEYSNLDELNKTSDTIAYTNNFRKTLATALNGTKILFIPKVEAEDHWQTLETLSEGDCEDFALTLRAALRLEYPEFASSFRITTAYTESNQYHAVLSIETDQGTLICDNRFPECASWETFPYRWKLREVLGSYQWQNLASATNLAQLATAGISKSR